MFKPRRHKVAVDPFYDPDFYNPETRHIIIPESAKERSDQGIIKYLGADVSDDLKIGDHVIFSGYTGTTIAVDKEILIEIHQDFIKAKVNTDDDETVPGLFFRAKIKPEDLREIFGEGLTDYEILSVLGKYDKMRMIPAPYSAAAHELNIAHEAISRRIKIKADNYIEQRDPIDERNR